MLRVFQRKQILDSVVLYSFLNEAVLDSLQEQMQIETIHQTSSLYNYSRSEKLAERELQKKREAWYWFCSFFVLVVILVIHSIRLYRHHQKEINGTIRNLDNLLMVSRAEQNNLKKELEILKSRNFDQIVAEKEQKVTELKQYISLLEGETGKSKGLKQENHFSSFRDSKIVSLFRKKALFTKEHPLPNKAEWSAITSQFVKDMPAAYQFFFSGKKLSELEFRTCILLILDFEEGTIAGLTQTGSSAVSIAKRRANDKLFNQKSATTLKYNLKRLI